MDDVKLEQHEMMLLQPCRACLILMFYLDVLDVVCRSIDLYRPLHQLGLGLLVQRARTLVSSKTS